MKANPPKIDDLLRRADVGERMALERVYGHAAAWLRDGKAPPEPLGAWIALRLLELSTAIGAVRDKDFPRRLDAAVARATKVRRSRRGKPPIYRVEIDNAQVVRDVEHFMAVERLSPAAAFRRVAQYWRAQGFGPMTADRAKKAWYSARRAVTSLTT